MASSNDITGDSIRTKGISEDYRANYDRIFGKKKPEIVSCPQTANTEYTEEEKTALKTAVANVFGIEDSSKE